MVALGTTLSAFWIMVNNSWMQVPVGYVVQNGAFVPDDWTKIVLNSVVWVRFPHMMLAAYLTGAFCVGATGAWYLLRNSITPRRLSCLAWAYSSQRRLSQSRSFSAISPAIMFTNTNGRNSPPKRGAGTTSSRPERS